MIPKFSLNWISSFFVVHIIRNQDRTFFSPSFHFLCGNKESQSVISNLTCKGKKESTQKEERRKNWNTTLWLGRKNKGIKKQEIVQVKDEQGERRGGERCEGVWLVKLGRSGKEREKEEGTAAREKSRECAIERRIALSRSSYRRERFWVSADSNQLKSI